jgi:hypothetical protein
MAHLLKLILLVIGGIWSAFRGVEEGLAAWVRHSSRERDLSGLSWA